MMYDSSAALLQPLIGLRVVDFGHYYAGPLAALLLADQGAEVTRVLRPGGAELPPATFELFNRDKVLREIDLKSAAGHAEAVGLVDAADVVIENFRPGVMARLGLDYASLSERNPKVIYLSLPGFASTDIARAGLQAWEGVAAAAAGVFTETSTVRKRLGFPPVYTAAPQCSTYAAVHGATAVMAALLARLTHGRGVRIEAPLLDAGLFGSAANYIFGSGNVSLPRPGDVAPELPAALSAFRYSPDDTQAEQLEKLHGAQRAKMYGPFGNFYTCADGRELIVWAMGHPGRVRALLTALGLYEEVLREGYVNASSWVAGLDNNLSDYRMAPAQAARLRELLAARLAMRTAPEWETVLEAAGVPVAMVRTRDEWLRLTANRDTGVVVERGDVWSPGPAVTLSNGRCAPVPPTSPAPATDVARDGTSQRKGDLLASLKVLDLSNIVAGPMSSYTLAQYGAQVIKADPPGEIGHSDILNRGMLEPGQGKRSILNDPTTEEGREVLHRLVRWADVVIHNCLDNTARRLGVTHSQLQAIKPGVVSCQLTAFGGATRGGWEARPGFDIVVQAASGAMARFGSLRTPLQHGSVSSGDVLSGLALGFVALLGVYARRSTGVAAEGRTSLARMMNYALLPFMNLQNGSLPDEPHGQFALGESWRHRLYKASDGWVFVGAGSTQALADTLRVESGDAAAAEAAFRTATASAWCERLRAAGIGAHRVLTIEEASARPREVDNAAADEMADAGPEFLHRPAHPCGEPVITMAPTWVRLGTEHSYRRLSVAPRLGQHTEEVLLDLGYDVDQVRDLIRLGICRTSLPVLGDPTAYFAR